MEARHSPYNLRDSLVRLGEILSASDAEFSVSNTVPSRETLTFTNGRYVSVTALFIDIRRSKTLARLWSEATMARLYRAFISECVAILKDCSTVQEVYIEGDCVWGIFATKYNTEVDEVFEIAAKVCSYRDILNWAMESRGGPHIRIGIGIADDYALVTKAGFKGSGNNEVVWNGTVVSRAAELCGFGERAYFDRPVMVDQSVAKWLCRRYQRYLEWNKARECWHTDIVNVVMDQWYRQHCV